MKARVRLGALAALACAAVVILIAGWLARRPGAVAAQPSEIESAGERLRAFDANRRVTANFAKLAPWDEKSGADPYAIATVPSSLHLVGILRGENAIVVLDRSLRELQRLPAPPSPVALAVGEDGAIWVAGEQAAAIAGFAWYDGALVPSGRWELGEVRAIRGLAAGPGKWVYIAEERKNKLIALKLAPPEERGRVIEQREFGTCRGPIRLERIGDRLIADCLLDHGLVIHSIEPTGAPSTRDPIRITHDGPIWSFAAALTGGGMTIAAGGVEDHPLDRTIGAFGFVDSFLFLYQVDFALNEARREATVNVSELGVVTPKAIALRTSPTVAVTVTGYGSDRRVDLTFDADHTRPPEKRTADLPPGANSVAALDDGTFAFANPLLDAWVATKRDGAAQVVPVAGARADDDVSMRLGEALFFTTLTAPFNRSDGPLSRFTCETCHYEGYVDGRIHHTGRGDVHAVTKPLLGLFNNRPHFSRALDPDLTAVAMNEFRVAGAKSDHDPWFSLVSSEVPWVRWLGWNDALLSPEPMRKALMTFLMTFQHRPNPSVLGRSKWSDDERAGAASFRDRCESCHEARLASDEPKSRVPYERWESLVMAREGSIVWAKDEYVQSGVLPYVHEKGARVPSLRRLYKKWPYFTNGSAKDLDSVLARVRFSPNHFWHEPPPDGAKSEGSALDEASRASLIAFLQLL